MNLQHHYTQLLKHHLSGVETPVIGAWDDDQYIITYDYFTAFLCPKNRFPFDIPTVFPNGVSDQFASLFRHSSDAIHARLTDDLKITVDGKIVRRITDGLTDVWVNEKLLKPYKPTSFVILGPKSPIAIYEGDTFVGAVLPVRMPTV